MRTDFVNICVDMGKSGISEHPQGQDGQVSVGQLEGILEVLEKTEDREDPLVNTEAYLKRTLKLDLKPYQMQSVYHFLAEEHSVGSGRKLWVELPILELQAPFLRDHMTGVARARERRAGGAADEDEFYAELEEEDMWREEQSKMRKEAGKLSRAARAARRLDDPSAVEMNEEDQDGEEGGAGTSAAAIAHASGNPGLGPAIAPKGLRLFFSPVLNVFFWGNNMKFMAQGALGTKQLAVSTVRGGCLWLEVGMGKTAVMIALMTLPTPRAWEEDFKSPELWTDAVLEDTRELGYAPKVRLTM